MKFKSTALALIGSLALLSNAFATTVNSFDLGGLNAAPAAAPAPDLKLAKSAGLKNAAQLLHSASNPVGGNPNGSVTLVEFFDYQCHHCIEMTPKIDSLMNSNGDLRVVYKEFPIRGIVSELAAKAALAANMQGKFHVFHDALMKAGENLTESKVMEIAKSVGLDMDQLKTQMNSIAISNQIDENYHLAQSMGINGTPAFFISNTSNPTEANTDVVMGQVEQSVLQKAITKSSH